jgi:hypothetical protein
MLAVSEREQFTTGIHGGGHLDNKKGEDEVGFVALDAMTPK